MVTTDEARGEEARRILDAALFKEAFRVIEERLVNELALVETNAERVERARNLLVALRKVRTYLEQVLYTGTMAAMEEERKSMAKRFLEKAQQLSIMGPYA